MTQLALALWIISATLLFVPLDGVVRLARRALPWRRRASAVDHSVAAPVMALPAVAVGSAPTGGPFDVPLPQPGVQVGHGTDEESEGVEGQREEPERELDRRAVEAASKPSAPVWLRFAKFCGSLAIFVIFIASSLYIVPRALVFILDTEHPMASITSQSMYPTLKRGELVLIEGVDDLKDLRVGDIVAFESDDSGFAIHRIVSIQGETIITKGDANDLQDPPITFDRVIGRALTIGGRLAKVPYLGNLPILFHQTSDEEQDAAPIYEGEPEAHAAGSD